MKKNILSIFNHLLRKNTEKSWIKEAEEQISKVDSIFDIAHIYPYVFSENINIAIQSATKITELLTQKDKLIPWVLLSQSYGRNYYSRNILKADLKKLYVFPEEINVHLFGISSMDPNGYLREAALHALEKNHSSAVIPYLLLRLNDWVVNVRNKAFEIFQFHLPNFHPIDLIKNFNLIIWLGKTNRGNLKDFQQKLYAYIIQTEFREDVLTYLKSACLHENIFFWQLLTEEIQFSPSLITQGLNNKFPEVRISIIDSLPKDDRFLTYIDALRKDSSFRVYYRFLRSIPKEFWLQCKSDFEQALFHPSQKIREYSRFVLKKLGYHDLREFYQYHLDICVSLNKVGLVSGWCEVAQPEDIQEVQALLNNPNSKIRASAYKALARIDTTKTSSLYVTGLKDTNSKVRHICSQILKEQILQVKEEIVLLLNNPRLEVRQLALNLLAAQKGPQALKSILFTIMLADEPLQNSAWKVLQKWYSYYSVRPYFAIDKFLYEEILTLYKKIEKEKDIPSSCNSLWRSKNGILAILELCKPKY